VITEVLASTRLSLPAAEEGELTPWRDAVANAVTEARTQLAVNLANDGGDLSAFHATLVGVIAAPEGGILFHIGDGAAVACETLGDWCRCVVSGPQNGEYANETAFFTLDRWRDNLRLKPFGPSELIVLMSDGSMPFVVAPDLAGLEQRFIEPVSHHLNQTDPATAAEDLVSALDAAPARAISKDDKTLLWARLKTDCDEDAIPPH
jgi:hypothetical protein